MIDGQRIGWCGLVAACALFATTATGTELESSLSEHWRWVHFTTASGLPSDDVTALVEGADGTPWVATGAGLAWYDGHRWNAIAERDGLPRQLVGSLAARPERGVAAVVGGAAYIGDSRGFRRVLTPPGKVDSLACLNDGALLIQVENELHRVGADGEQQLVVIPSLSGRVTKVFPSRPGRALVAGHASLHSFDGKSWSTVVNYGPSPAAWADIRQSLLVGEDEVLFTMLQPYSRQGAWRWSGGGEPTRIDTNSMESVTVAAARSDGTVVLAYESGAIGLAEGGAEWRRVVLPPVIGGASTLAFRPNGDLWAGTTRGLWLFRVSSERWADPQRSEEADANLVHALLRASDGRLWVGSRAGLEIRDDAGGVESLREIDGRPIPVVTAIAEDGEGSIWIGSGSGFEGAWRWKDGRWEHFGEAEGLGAPHVHAVRVDSQGRPWFLGLSRHAFRGGSGAWIREDSGFLEVSPPGDEHAQRVHDFAEGPPGTHWLATRGGLRRLSHGRWTSWTSEDLLPANRIFTVTLDENHRPWFGLDGHGVCHLPDDETLESENSTAGLPNDSIWALAFDDDGVLWTSTAGGLGARRDGEWSRILPHHGLPLLRLWPLLVEGDRLLVGTNGRGLAELRLAESRHPPPRVGFLEPESEFGVARVAWRADAWWGSQAELEVETRWRLDAADWSPWSRRRELVFEDLTLGAQVLEVQAKGLFAERGSPARLDFEVPSPLLARPEVLVPTLLVLVSLAGWLGFGAWRRRSFAREIAQREQRFAEILDNVADVIFTAGLDGRLTSLNRAGVELAGPAGEDPGSLSWETLLGPDSRERASEALRQKISKGGSSTYEVEFIGADGESHVLEVHSRMVQAKGRQPEIQGVARDVSERRRLEDQLQHAQKMESLGLLAGGVAHDFNNLLLSILGNLDLARGAWREGRSPRQALDDLEAAAERATDLARVMLAYSGKARFEIKPLDLSELAEEILRLLRASLPSTIEFRTTLAAGLPAIEGDRAQVQQVILNLVTNAADAIGSEHGTITVRTGTAPGSEPVEGEAAIEADHGKGTLCWLEVSDSGPGIEASSRSRIFDPFFTTKGPGRGLGLSAVLGIVRVHGGALHVGSVDGEGARFRVAFPALDAPAPPLDTRAARSRAHAEDLSGSRVLVVDDEDRVRDVACRLLERAGCEVLSARDGLEAQEVVREEAGRLDAVLLDLVMPRCSGEQALVAIREMAPDLPVVLTSGYTEQEASAREVGSGPTSFLVKPYRLADLETALQAAFASREPSQAND